MDTQTGGEGQTIQSGEPPVKKPPVPKVRITPQQEQSTMSGAVELNRFVQGTETPQGNETAPPPVKQVPNSEYWGKVYDWVSKNPSLKTKLSFDDFVGSYSDPLKMSKLYSAIQKTSVNYPRNFAIGGSFEDFQKMAYKPYSVPSGQEMVDSLIKETPEDQFVPSVEERAAKPFPGYSTTVMAVENINKAAAGENVNDIALAASLEKTDKVFSKVQNPFYQDPEKSNAGYGTSAVDTIKADVPAYDEMNQVDNILLSNALGKDLSYTTAAQREKMYAGRNFDPSSIWGANKEFQTEDLDRQKKIQHDVDFYKQDFEVLDDIVKRGDWKKGAELIFALSGIPKGMSEAEMKAEVMDEYNFVKKQYDTAQARMDGLTLRTSSSPEQAAELPDDIEDTPLFSIVKTYWDKSKNMNETGGDFSYEKQKARLIYDGYITRGKKVKTTLEEIDAIENYLIGQEEKRERSLRYWKDPNYVATYEGYYQMINERQHHLERGVGEFVDSLNKTIKEDTDKKVSDMSAKIQTEYNRDIEFYTNKISNQFAPAYEQAFLSSAEGRQLREYYLPLINAAKSPEEKAKLQTNYNEHLAQIPAFSEIAAQQNKAVNEINIALKAKYDDRISTANRRITDLAHDRYFNDLRNHIQKNFSFGINDDKGALEYVNQNIANSPAFHSASYGDKKKMLTKAWDSYKATLVKDLYSDKVRVPANEEEQGMPWYKWTGSRPKTDAEKKTDFNSLKRRTGDLAKREFMFNAMDKVMFSSKSQKPTVFQMKSWAEQNLEDIEEEIKRISSEQKRIPIKEHTIGSNVRKMAGGYTQQELEAAQNPQDNQNIVLRLNDRLTKLMLAKDKFSEIINHKETDTGFFSDLWESVSGGKAQEYIPFVSSIFDIQTNYTAYKASRKVQDGKPLSYIEKTTLEAMAGLKQIESLRPKSWGTWVGSGIKDMVPFIGEFAMTGGAFRVGSELTKNFVKSGLKKKLTSDIEKKTAKGAFVGIVGKDLVESEVDDILENTAAKYYVGALQTVVGSLAQTSANPQLVASNFLDRITPEVGLFLTGNAEDVHALVESKSLNRGFGEAFTEALGLSWAELFTEQLGGTVFNMPKGVMPKLMNDTGWLQRSVLGGWYRAKKFVTKSDALNYIIKNNLGWHGIMQEYAEEFTNGRLSALITGDKDVWDIDANEEMKTFLLTSIFGGGVGVLHTAPKVVKSVLNKNNDVDLTVERTNYGEKKPELATISINRQAWKKFNTDVLGGKGLNIKELNNFLDYNDFNEAQKDVLTGIYNQVKAKYIKDNPTYKEAVEELKSEGNVEISDNWNSEDATKMPEVEGEDFDESAVPSEKGGKRIVLPHDEFVAAARENGMTATAAKRLVSGFVGKDGNQYLSNRFASQEQSPINPVDMVETPMLGDKQITKDPVTSEVTEQEVVDVDGDEVSVRDNRSGAVIQKTREEYALDKANSDDKANVANLNYDINTVNNKPDVIPVEWNKKKYDVSFDTEGNVVDVKDQDGSAPSLSKISMTGLKNRAIKQRTEKPVEVKEAEATEPLSPVEEEEFEFLKEKEKDLEEGGRELPVKDQERIVQLSGGEGKKLKPKKDAVQKPKTEGMDVRKQTGDGKKVGKGDAKKQTVAKESKVKAVKEKEVAPKKEEKPPFPETKKEKPVKKAEATKEEKPKTEEKEDKWTRSKEGVYEYYAANKDKFSIKKNEEGKWEVTRKSAAGGREYLGEYKKVGEAKEKADKYTKLSDKQDESPKVEKKKPSSPEFEKMKGVLDALNLGKEGSLKGVALGKATKVGDLFFGEALKDAQNKKQITEDEYNYLDATYKIAVDQWKLWNPTGVKTVEANPQKMGDSKIVGAKRKPLLQIQGTSRLNAVVGNIATRLGKAFPNVNVVTQWEEFLKAAVDFGYQIEAVEGITGMYSKGTVYLNPKKSTPNTAMEEFAHLWIQVAKETSAPIYQRGIDMAKQTKYYTDVQKDPQYNHLSEEEKANEALAKAIADKGEKILEKRNAFSQWLKTFWETIKRKLGINPRVNLATTTLDEYTSKVANELLNEVPISTVTSEMLAKIESGNTTPVVKVSHSILAPNNRFDRINSWKNYWFSESKGAGKELSQKLGQSKGRVDRSLKDAAYTVQNFNNMLKEHLDSKYGKNKEEKKKATERILKNVDAYLKQEHAYMINKIPKLLRPSAIEMRDSINMLQKKLAQSMSDWGIMTPELEATFTQNMGIWVHRSYMMHDVPNYHKLYKDILSPDQLSKAEAVIRNIYESGKISGLRWETAKDGTKIVTFTNKNGIDSPQFTSVETDLEDLVKRAIPAEQDAAEVADAIKRFDKKEMSLSKLTPKQTVVPFRLTSDNIESIMESIVADGRERGDVIGGAVMNSVGTGAFESSVLKKRGEIDPAIRALMGEYLDPRMNFMKSVSKVAQLVEKGKIEHELKLQGEGSFFRKSNKKPEGRESAALSRQITPSESYLLQGYWTTPEIHDMLFRKPKSSSTGLIQGLSMLNGLAKASLTVLKDDSQARNFWGAALNMMATGHLPTGLTEATMTATRDFSTGQRMASVMSSPLFVSMLAGEGWLAMKKDKEASREAFKEAYLDAVKYNLIEQSVEAGALKDIADKLYTDVVIGSGLMRARIKAAKGYKTFMDTFSKPYQASDSIFKIIQWEKEKKALAKAYAWMKGENGLSKEDFDDFVKSKAAELVRAEQPTYSKSSEAMRWLSRMPLFGSFVMFQSQMWKTRRALIRNIVDLRKEAAGAKNDTQREVLNAMANKRIAGLLFSLSFTPILAIASAYAMGYSWDDDDAVSEMFPSYGENAIRLYLSPDKKNPVFLDMSFVDPSSQWHKMIVALIRGEDTGDKITGFLKEGLEPFLSQEIAFQRLTEIYNNKDQYGKPITNPQDYWTQRWGDNLSHISEVLIPGFINTAKKIYKGATGYENDAGYEYHMWQEIMNSRLGVKAKDREMPVAFRSQARTYWDGMGESKKIYVDALFSKEASESDRKSAFDRASKAAYANFLELRRKYEAMKQIGFDRDEIRDLMKESPPSGLRTESRPLIPKYMIRQIENNEFRGIDPETGEWVGSSKGGDMRSGMSFDVTDLDLNMKLDMKL